MKLHPKADGETGRTTNEIWLSKLDVFELTILQMVRLSVRSHLLKFLGMLWGIPCDVKFWYSLKLANDQVSLRPVRQRLS